MGLKWRQHLIFLFEKDSLFKKKGFAARFSESLTHFLYVLYLIDDKISDLLHRQ